MLKLPFIYPDALAPVESVITPDMLLTKSELSTDPSALPSEIISQYSVR